MELRGLRIFGRFWHVLHHTQHRVDPGHQGNLHLGKTILEHGLTWVGYIPDLITKPQTYSLYKSGLGISRSACGALYTNTFTPTITNIDQYLCTEMPRSAVSWFSPVSCGLMQRKVQPTVNVTFLIEARPIERQVRAAACRISASDTLVEIVETFSLSFFVCQSFPSFFTALSVP